MGNYTIDKLNKKGADSMRKTPTTAEKNTKEQNDFNNFMELMKTLADLPPEMQEKVGLFAQGIIAATEMKKVG